MITLRPYQEAGIAGLRQAFRDGYHSPLFVLPTGGGKTVCFSYLTSRLIASGKRVQILVHREELIDQVSRTLTSFNVRHGIIGPNYPHDPIALAHVSSVFSLVRRLDRLPVPDYVICDEAHHCIGESSWGKVVKYWRAKNPALRLIGVTATPCRLSGEGLGEMFDQMVLGPSVRELMDLGALSQYRLFAPSTVDSGSMRSVGGDFRRGEASEASAKIIGCAVTEYTKICPGRPAVAFCPSLDHPGSGAHAVADRFRAAGYSAVSLDGKMDRGLRRQAIQDFQAGQLQVITSCDLISEGFDVPGIETVILLRPTQSLALYLQQIGRGFRPKPTPYVILDHVGNTARHGMPDDPREWSLTGTKGRKTKAAEAAVRQCGKCFAMSPAAAARCRECGNPFPLQSREIEEVAGELTEIEIEREKREARKAQGMARDLESLIALGRMRGMKNPDGWARHVMAAREKKEARG